METNLCQYESHRAEYIEQCSKRLFMDKFVHKLTMDTPMACTENEEIMGAMNVQFMQSSERFIQSVHVLKSISKEVDKGNFFPLQTSRRCLY